jgi:hypothetical protein
VSNRLSTSREVTVGPAFLPQAQWSFREASHLEDIREQHALSWLQNKQRKSPDQRLLTYAHPERRGHHRARESEPMSTLLELK